ncbi:competence protein ComFB [Thermoanaerobacteraceae bacterium SP2]|nr:competence protein ComFB [Thermoanaerobacteraceae bacterium SP2]
MKLKNYMEDVVFYFLPTVLKDIDGICKCEDCVNDIAALTLNKLKPHYVSSEKGEIYSRLEEMYTQFRVDVIAAIMESIQQVSKNPRHKSV